MTVSYHTQQRKVYDLDGVEDSNLNKHRIDNVSEDKGKTDAVQLNKN